MAADWWPVEVLALYGCWEWLGARERQGYGVAPGGLMAHRVVYEAEVGPIADGKQLDHLCRNRACVRPEHLEQVTPSENVRRREYARRRRERCPGGHDLWSRGRRTPQGGVVCLECAPVGAGRPPRAGG